MVKNLGVKLGDVGPEHQSVHQDQDHPLVTIFIYELYDDYVDKKWWLVGKQLECGRVKKRRTCKSHEDQDDYDDLLVQ